MQQLFVLGATTRLCRRCGDRKQESEFYKDAQQRDGLATWCKPCKQASNKRSYERNPESYRERWLRYAYGLTLDQHSVLVADGCSNPSCDDVRGLAVDHDHSTGRVRGALCANCNRALGLLADDVKRIRGLADYLEKK